jgi:alpha 1,2-mannosyltransferase
MSPKLRGRRIATLVVFLCAIFYLHSSAPASLPGPLKPTVGIPLYDQLTSDAGSPSVPDGIQSLWGYWSDIFYDDRPGTPHIVLRGTARAVSLSSDDDGPRQPSTNRVINPEIDIEQLRASHAALLETLQSEAVVGDMFNGTGVVILGGGEYFGPAIIGLHMLRKTGSALPVEIFVANMREYEPGICEDYLPRYGARCLVLSHFLENGNASQVFGVTHYQLKSLALLFSSFAEILYLDSDSIPLVDPSTELFSTEPYKSSGLVIWPDFWVSTESPLFYIIAGLPAFPPDLPKSASESGQLLINKRTHLKTLLLSVYYNIYGPEYYYPLLSQGALGEGDKETFMAAALVAAEPYYRVKTGVTAVGRHNGRQLMGTGMVQHHPLDDLLRTGTNDTVVRPAFLHSNTPKMNAGHLVDEGDLFAVDKKRLRLWGSLEDQEKRFGYDLEKVVWELLVKTGCELEKVIREWKGRRRMCGRLKEHWKAVF